jgi:spermidine synthase
MTRFNALLLTVLTGFSGLVYEVAWQKYVATLLGSHAEATAAVLAIFLGGLSTGYAVFGAATQRQVERARGSGRPPRLLLFYALVESGIGIYALLFPTLFGAAQSLSLFFPLEHAALGFAFDVFLTALLIGPAAVLMGGTIPILTLALAGDLEHATRVHAWIYGFNTAGAFVGALIGGFFLIPLLGLDGVLYAMGAVNLLAGVSFAVLDRIGGHVTPDMGEPSPRSVAVKGFASYAAVAMLGGFAMMAVQTTLNRIGGLAFGSSHFTFTMVVAVFVLSIALGSLAVSALPRITPGLIVGSQWLLVLLLALLYLHMPDAPYWAHVIRSIFRPVDASFYPFYFLAFTAGLAVLIVPIGLAGALLPLLFHHLRNEVGDLGSVAGRLYSWNTAGSLLGALLGGYLLLFWLDLHHVYRIALAALIVGASILTVRVLRLPALAMGALVVLPALLSLLALPAWSPEKLASGLFRQREPGPLTYKGPNGGAGRGKAKIIFNQDGPTSTVTVKDGPMKNGRISRGLITNGKPDGNLVGDYSTMALTALIPALLANNIERSFVIGYGTGVTAGELAALDLTREVTVAEISHGVIAAAPLFDIGNLNATKNPKLKIVRGDAYRVLLRSYGYYFLFLSVPSNPWVVGV